MYALPEPVCPYAKMVTAYPLIASCNSCCARAVWKTVVCEGPESAPSNVSDLTTPEPALPLDRTPWEEIEPAVRKLIVRPSVAQWMHS